jgi:hypothetical protein
MNAAPLGSLPATNRRVPHISLVFREMWDTRTFTSIPLGSYRLDGERCGLLRRRSSDAISGDVDGMNGAAILNIVERILVQHDQIRPLTHFEGA